MHEDFSAEGASSPTIAAKVEFLSRPAAYGVAPNCQVTRRETHMSWVFLVGDKVYKLKKPVRFSYLDFSTRAKREAACRAELSLNRRLAPDVYLAVVALVVTPQGLAIGGAGCVVDWLVVMRRLDDRFALDELILQRRLDRHQLQGLITTLGRFYRRAKPVAIAPAAHLCEWHKRLLENQRILLDPRFVLPRGLVRRADRAQRRFLDQHSDLLAQRVSKRRVIDGHGDLRPEHVWLNDRVRVIDCLEFNDRLRAIDPFDEIAFLGLECTRLGAEWADHYLRRVMAHMLHDEVPPELFLFYRCYRACLRARLAIAHLFEAHPRTPEKWPSLAWTYLDLAGRDAVELERLLRTRRDRRAIGRHAGALSPRRGAARR
jgi:aminoglycoside phosphotransferase family enzyme